MLPIAFCVCVMNRAEIYDGEKRSGSGFTKQLSV